MSVVCRRAAHPDLAQLARSTAELNAQTAGPLDPTVSLSWPEADSPLGYPALLGDPSWLILVAEHRGAVIGHLAGVIGQPAGRTVTVATIFSVHVSAAHRGHGAGSALVGAFRTWAREQSARVLEVSTYTANCAALRFYQRHGFSPYTSTLQQSLPESGPGG